MRCFQNGQPGFPCILQDLLRHYFGYLLILCCFTNLVILRLFQPRFQPEQSNQIAWMFQIPHLQRIALRIAGFGLPLALGIDEPEIAESQAQQQVDGHRRPPQVINHAIELGQQTDHKTHYIDHEKTQDNG